METQARYIKVKNHILDGIRQRRWSEGERVPSENELVSACDVSRMTARRALKELSSEGVLYSKQGQGTFVASAKKRSSFMTIKNIADEIHERNHQHTSLVISLEKIQPNEELVTKLGWTKTAPIFFSRIVHFENNLAIQLEERFINGKLAPDYLTQDFQAMTPNEYLSKVCPINEAEHQVEAIMPSSEIQQWLDMPTNEPCLKLTRTTWSEKQIASYAWLYHPGSRFQLGSHITMKKEIINE